MFGGHIKGLSKEDAHHWADETPSIKKLPERAPAEKGKPTLRSKKAAFPFPHDAFKEKYLGHKRPDDPEVVRDRARHPIPAGEPDKDYDARELHPAHWNSRGGPEYQRMAQAWDQKYGPRSKKANGDMLQYFLDHPDKAEAHFERQRKKKASAEAAVDQLERAFVAVIKAAALGAATMNPRNVGKLKGMMTTHSLKAPGYGASQQAMNPRRNVISAMNFGKPH